MQMTLELSSELCNSMQRQALRTAGEPSSLEIVNGGPQDCHTSMTAGMQVKLPSNFDQYTHMYVVAIGALSE